MSDHNNKREVDHLSGVETTGHEWDGLKELNNPLPRWWLWVFYATVIWSGYYFVVYPSWPTLSGATEGTSGYTQYKELKASQEEIMARQAAYLARFEKASFEDIMADPELYAFALAGGQAAFKDNCATCHGTGAQGGKGYPNLNDDDWLWGGKLEDIHYTLQHGVRQSDPETRISQMPAFGKDELLSREQIDQVADYVYQISQPAGANAGMPGHAIFQENCASCHGEDAKGNRDLGAPNLTDAIWLYGGNKEDIFNTVYNARYGMMPAWGARLDEQTIRQLTVYVHELGGGESKKTPQAAPAAAPSEPEAQAPAEQAPAADGGAATESGDEAATPPSAEGETNEQESPEE